jgi:hypothetical protein
VKRRTKLFLVCTAVFVLVPLGVVWLVPSGERMVDKTREELRGAGFKVDLKEFDFSSPVEVQARVAALTNLGGPRPYALEVGRRRLSEFFPGMLPMVGPNAGRVIWKEERLQGKPEARRYLDPNEGWLAEDVWPLLRSLYEEERAEAAKAAKAAVAGPIRFDVDAGKGLGMLLPHLASLKQYGSKFARGMVMELRGGNREEAWTNLLAASRLVTGWESEPVEISHLVRFACAKVAFEALWQGLAAGWNEERLAGLQRDWEEVDLLKGLPETAAFTRAGAARLSQAQREEPVEFGMTIRQMISAPRAAMGNVSYYFQRLRYRRSGVFEVEREALLHFRDREVEMRNAVKAGSWEEMRAMPGVTNLVPFQSEHGAPLVSVLNVKQLAYSMYDGEGARSFLGRASEVEAHRRIMVTAIALERYRVRHGRYPDELGKLVPEFLKEEPVDFMDGKPLRYRLGGDGRFLLYSVGLDGADDGGVVSPKAKMEFSASELDGIPRRRWPEEKNSDIVWPLRATDGEIEDFEREQLAEMRKKVRKEAAEEAELHWSWTASRQEHAETILTRRYERPPMLKKDGVLLSELLSGEGAGDGGSTMEKLLALEPVAGGDEATMRFELGMDFDALVKHGTVALMVDFVGEESWPGMLIAEDFDCVRGTNGNAVITWNTIYEVPGKHALQVALQVNEAELFKGDPEESGVVMGPPKGVVVTNICQFAPRGDGKISDVGWTVRARAEEDKVEYRVRFTARDGKLLKTMEGRSTDGVIAVEWDLKTEEGEEWAGTFESEMEVTLPESGRRQVFRF